MHVFCGLFSDVTKFKRVKHHTFNKKKKNKNNNITNCSNYLLDIKYGKIFNFKNSLHYFFIPRKKIYL